MRVRRNKTGIDHRRNVMLDKSALVSGFAAQAAEIIFPTRQRTNPDEILHEKSPDKRGQMQFPNRAATQNKQSAEDRKKDKAEMKD